MSYRYAFRAAIKLPTASLTTSGVEAALATIQSCVLEREDLEINTVRVDPVNSLMRVRFEGKLPSPAELTLIDSSFEQLGHCAIAAFALERPNRDDLPTKFFGPDQHSIEVVRRHHATDMIRSAIRDSVALIPSLSSDQQDCLREIGDVITATIDESNGGTLVAGVTSACCRNNPDGFVDQFLERRDEVRQLIAEEDSPYSTGQPLFYLDRRDLICWLRTLACGPDNAYTQADEVELDEA